MNVDTDPGATYMPTILAFRGRLGRLRLLVYTVLPMFAVFILLALLVFLRGRAPVATVAMARLLPLLWLVLVIVTTLRRLDDMNYARWWGLLMLVPPVNVLVWFYLLFVAGSETANERGPAPAPNTVMVKLGVVLVVPLLLGSVWPAYMLYSFYPFMR
ncbi:DUF805 domain-containing protein [Massilia sp. DJPM01]|uniref:DUF805 domain-containing protein n=1 Tax=Massilia sp. DJPM01 TaxID=3024404 RepID=UPI00259E4A54|nr:DUF805 domain-containing protein [Massilia sp. DJPM01]MDM5177145.1 DUF805 domain-containing protein [Massilia sp. DJPM01]